MLPDMTRFDYAGPADLRAMQGLAARLWSPRSRWHVGDLAWNRYLHVGREPEWATSLWEFDGEVVAWCWAEESGEVSLCVDPARADLVDEVLAWGLAAFDVAAHEAWILDAEEHLAAGLVRADFAARTDGPFFLHTARPLEDVPTPALPAGFTVRPVRGAADAAGWADVHGSAFHPSRVTAESYLNVTAAWPYRAAFDHVVVAPDGRFAAYCLGWYDEANRVGEFEPVGTRPEFRRLGLARAVCASVLHAFRAAGGESAVVRPRGDDEYPQALALYTDLGFTGYARTVSYARTR
ncbi:N-acetyltransferase [Longispora fulva]|nr:N-acetyltransferase [Longispora fulva]